MDKLNMIIIEYGSAIGYEKFKKISLLVSEN